MLSCCFLSILSLVLISPGVITLQWNPSSLRSNRGILVNRHQSSSSSSTLLHLDLLNEFPISTAIASTVGLYGLISFAAYTKMQYVTASMVSGVPPNSKVVEIDVQDGRNIFYLSNNCDYTAIMSIGNDPKKQIEKSNFNERVILESIGKANM